MTELLAPAGDIISLKTAIASGADAVYLGLSAFNARIKADNFNEDNIFDVVKYCHIFGVKVYITLNTQVKESELLDIDKVVTLCKKANVDAFIVCDFAVIDAIKRICPEIPMHASTQMGVCNVEGAKVCEDLGFTRVVLSREVTIDEIKAIKKETNLEIEYFVQGALCVAFSGKCLLSSITNGGSGNRGRCLQPCRLEYREESGKKGYLLSTSDLCLINRLKELSECGVSSFKIEGRLRRPEYVYKTVSIYRKVIDNNFVASSEDFETLKGAFNRGNFSEGYCFSNTQKLMSIKNQGNIGVCVGKINYVKNNFVKIDKNYKFELGQGYKLFDGKGNEVGGGRIEKIENLMPKIPNAKVGYIVHITDSGNFLIDYKKLDVNCFANFDDNGFMTVKYTINDSDIYSIVKYEKPFDRAQNPDNKIKERIVKALSKCGDNEYFNIKNCEVNYNFDYYTPLSILNNIRRQGLDNLANNLLNNYKKQEILPKNNKSIIKNTINHNSLLAIEFNDVDKLHLDCINKNDILIYNPDILTLDNCLYTLSKLKDKKVFLKTLPNAREKDILVYKTILENCKFVGVYADNLYGVYLAKLYNLDLFLGLGFNIYNNKIFNYIPCQHYLASCELSYNELSNFNNPFVFSFGYLPLMNLSHCVSQLILGGDCGHCKYNKPFTYYDRKNYAFKIVRNKVSYCYFTVFNSKITNLSQKYLNCGFNYYLNMVQCEKDNEIINCFNKGIPLIITDFTYGHMQRGVK